jgi:hypothetical protein
MWRAVTFVAAVAWAVCVEQVSADVVELRNGQRVDGVFRQGSGTNVTIEVGGQRLTFPSSQVRAIYFGTAPASTGTPQASGRQDALKALRGLQSVTAGGVTYREYGGHVNDANVRVDEYLREPTTDDGGTRAAIAAAMRYYVIASSVWSTAISSDDQTLRQLRLTPLREDPLIKQCPDSERAFNWVELMGQASQVALFWKCAGDKITEAEHLAK